MRNGKHCIPQHYLCYLHTRASVELIVCDIDYWDRYPVFVSEDKGGIYIQIGIIGVDNYAPSSPKTRQKIVYGRRWRVEPNLPTSEIIQTVFLALKKAREHEIRELFRFSHNGRITTPMNAHHDLPLIAQNADLVQDPSTEAEENLSFEQIQAQLRFLRYDGARLILKSLEKRTKSDHIEKDQWIVDIAMRRSPSSRLPEVQDQTLSFLLDALSMNAIYYELMAMFLRLSDQHVDEYFMYKNHARFSRNNSVMAIANLSFITRQTPDDDFSDTLKAVNYETDVTRVPQIFSGPLSAKLKTTLARFGPLSGVVPD
ncbi:MAG: hypothetical protein COA69_06135 [Robiginitomaculum sp.]|nr:MAG: hypothetical protein COA69_06135 [Robiginitomaculum sp.]